MSDGASGPAPRRPTLELASGGERVVLELLGSSTVLGSSEAADLVLTRPGVAARHVRFEIEGERVFAVALDAAHPLLVQGVERKEWLLRDGDEVRIGELGLVFRWAEARAERAGVIPRTATARLTAPTTSPQTAPPIAARTARSESAAEPREPRTAPKTPWPWPAKVFFLLVLGASAWFFWTRSRIGPVDDFPPAAEAYRSTDGLEPFFYYAIYPISERLDQYPDAARLVEQRCRSLLAECGDPRTCVLAQRALANARARISGSIWTLAEVRYATEQAPTGGRPPEYFRAEQRGILQAFLASNPGGADRYVAEAKLKQLDR